VGSQVGRTRSKPLDAIRDRCGTACANLTFSTKFLQSQHRHTLPLSISTLLSGDYAPFDGLQVLLDKSIRREKSSHESNIGPRRRKFVTSALNASEVD